MARSGRQEAIVNSAEITGRDTDRGGDHGKVWYREAIGACECECETQTDRGRDH